MAALTAGAIVGFVLKSMAAGGLGAIGGALVKEGMKDIKENMTGGAKIEVNEGTNKNLTPEEEAENKRIYEEAMAETERKYQENLAFEKTFLENIASGNIPQPWEEEKTPAILPEINPSEGTTEEPTIKDETNTNLENQINWLDQIEKWRNEQWAREDAIRAETQAREDSAYQRSVKDMKAAGINPNLMNVQPASAGGGISNATGVDTSALTNQMQIDLDEMQQLIDNAFKGDENSKDRFMQVFANVIQMLAMKLILKG